MTEPVNVAEVFGAMPDRFNADAADGMDATYEFVLSGDDGGTWHIAVRDGACVVGVGPADHANIRIEMSAADYLEMVMGRLSPQIAFMTDRLRITGDMALATKMQQIFPPGAS